MVVQIKRLISVFFVFTLLLGGTMFFDTSETGTMVAYAKTGTGDSFKDSVKLDGNGSGSISDVTDLVKDWITNIRVIGALIAVFGIVLGAILLGVSLGNPSRRAMGIASMACACIAIVAIAKAPMLANYFVGQ